MTTTTTRDEAEIREIITGKVTAMRERDADLLVAHYSDDIVMFNLAPPLQQPVAYARDAGRVRDWLTGFAGPVDFEVRDLEVVVGGDVAYCHAMQRLTATPHDHPEGFTLWFRATYGLHKVDGTWRIAHEHESTPFHMDGEFGAAVDLEP